MLAVVLDWITGLILVAASFFFLAGSVGAVRFPDVYMRLHAVTKADNVGLGLLILALSLQARSALEVMKLVLIWAFVLLSGAVGAHLIGRVSVEKGVEPWR